MIETAPAKINLYLHVLGRAANGYHELDSLVVFAAGGDVLRGSPSEAFSFDVEGPFAGALTGENLVARAAHALAAAAGVTMHGRLTLEKYLPVASGIGGGSSDAAAALRLLARLWGVTGVDLRPLAARLGADVPVCLAARPARLRGIGERLDPAPALPPYGLALVNPGVAVATADIFRARSGAWSEPARLPAAWPTAEAMAADLARLRNDLAAPAIALCPLIADVLAALRAQPGCLFAAMSGSGATCFGLFRTPAAAAAIRLPQAWWRWPGAPP